MTLYELIESDSQCPLGITDSPEKALNWCRMFLQDEILYCGGRVTFTDTFLEDIDLGPMLITVDPNAVTGVHILSKELNEPEFDVN